MWKHKQRTELLWLVNDSVFESNQFRSCVYVSLLDWPNNEHLFLLTISITMLFGECRQFSFNTQP